MKEFVIRRASDDDTPKLSRLKREVWETTYRGIYPDEKLDGYDFVLQAKKFRRIIENSTVSLFVAELDGEVVGYMSCGKPMRPFSDYEQEIGLLYVCQDCQGMGLGKRLFRLAEEEIKKNGYDRFFVSCNKYNIKARAFYERMGGILVAEDADRQDKSEVQVKYHYNINAVKNVHIRAAELRDAEALVEIYNPYILTTTVTYECEAVSADEFRRRMEKIMEKLPFIVAEEDDVVVGYAYASPYHERAAYQWDCDLSVYIRMDRRGRGTGKLLVGKLLDVLTRQGYVTVYSLIDHPNEASFRLHRSFGFVKAGHFTASGWKFGRWLDMTQWEKKLSQAESPGLIDNDWRKYL